MPVTIPNTFVAGQRARAAEVNANFQALKAKFTEATGGISDADCATNMDLNSAAKLSSTAGKRVTNAKLEDDCVDARALKKDATAGSPNAAVNALTHVKDGLFTKAKLSVAAGTQISLAQLDIFVETVNFSYGSGFAALPVATVFRGVVGANYVATLEVDNLPPGANVTPVAMPLPVASRTLLAVYIADVGLGGGGQFQGKVVFVSIPNT